MRNFIIALALIVTGCSFENGTGQKNQIARDLQERKALLDTFSLVTGIYVGTIDSGNRKDAVEVKLYTQDEPTGQRDGQGQPITRPSLYGRLKTTEINRFLDSFKVRFYRETGEMTFLNLQSAKAESIASIQSLIDLNSHVIQGRLVSPQGGDIGYLNVTLVPGTGGGTGPQKPGGQNPDGGGEVNERNELLRRLYTPLVGTYQGKFSNLSRPTRPESKGIVVKIVLSNQTDTAGNVIPVLLGQYQLDDSFGILPLPLQISFHPDQTPAKINLTSEGVTTRPGGYFVTLDGVVLPNGHITGQQWTQLGPTGDFELVKDSQ